MKLIRIVSGIVITGFIAAVAIAADRKLSKQIETIRIKSNGKAVAELRIIHPVSFGTSINDKETPVSPGVSVVSNATVTVTFSDATITIKATETEIIRLTP
jgi:hypothetical protein